MIDSEGLNAALGDRYRVQRELGRGGMATVYLAEDLKHGRQVAIKVLRPELATALGPDRFLREIEIAAKLTHPHILPLHDSGATEGFLYYVMPYVEGESLRDRLRREKQLPIDEALAITGNVASALSHAHSHGVVHRDIKPENILLLAGEAMVADFGVARAISAAGGEHLTETGFAVGTPAYMSPEQASGDTEVDPRTDIYGLGCVVYEMLTGDPPFTASTPQSVMARKFVEPPPPLRTVRDTVSPAVERAVLKALARLPADRFATVSQFAEALAQAAAGSPGFESAPPLPATGTPPMVRRKRWVLAAALVGTVAVVSVAVLGWPRQAAEWEVVAALTDIDRLTGESDFAEAYALAASLDRRIGNDSVRRDMWARVALPVTLETEPSGARVQRRDYAPADAPWRDLGTTPLTIERFPLGQSRIRFELQGHQSREIAASANRIAELGVLSLDREGVLPPGMVRVSGRAGGVAYGLYAPGLEQVTPLDLPDFLMAVHEVTNEEYKAFVDAGGYDDPRCWRHTFVERGARLTFQQAMTRFRDATGRPGPSTWNAGIYPRGSRDLPVGGLSWYEAEAYACFVGMALPTVYHWYAAADPFSSHHVVPLSNFGDAAAPVGQYAGVSRDGIYDLAGNVREWTRNAHGDARFILGGGWADLEYAFNDAVTAPAFDRSPLNGIRLVRYPDTTNLQTASAPLALAFRDYRAERPVPDEVFAVYRQVYAYDRTPLNARIVETDTTDLWVRERVELDAGYGGERLTTFVFLPRGHRGPHQPVVFFPGSNVIYRRSYADLNIADIDFILRSGRALVYPIYKGTFERGTDLRSDIQDESNGYRDHVIAWTKDLRRSVDYLASREDIALDRLGYLGVSWGGAVAPIMTVLEERIRAVVIVVGGLLMQDVQPVADPFHFLPRVRQPTLMLNARWDSFYPLETAQRPFFDNLGTAQDHKKLVIIDANHGVLSYARNLVVRESLEWLDRYLGPVR